ncbi:MAG: hypothetical protein JWP01_2581 [Myxococcales bacterium]|nr:hypothetical protein [Myxococcales bacterium]
MARWIEAGGDHQVPFMAAASRAARGQLGRCPACSKGDLRCYFHAFKPAQHQGTVWLWCGACHTSARLARVQPTGNMPVDPFASLTTEQFTELETAGQPFLDRLEQLWVDGTLALPTTTS